MNTSSLLHIEREEGRLTIDAREAIRKGLHPRGDIVKLIEEAPQGTLCDVLVPHHAGPLKAALEEMGMNVAISEVERNHWRLRVMKF